MGLILMMMIYDLYIVYWIIDCIRVGDEWCWDR